MKKILLNNKGFALVETIIVSIFMISIFMILYSNFYPLMGKYEKREYYDDVDSKYKAFWLKYIIEDSTYLLTLNGNDYTYFDCNNVKDSTDFKYKVCNEVVSKMEFSSNEYCKKSDGTSCTSSGPLRFAAIITTAKLDKLQNIVSGYGTDYDGLANNISDGFLDYILSLPSYSNINDEINRYRLLVEFYDSRNNLYKYAQIEVNKS